MHCNLLQLQVMFNIMIAKIMFVCPIINIDFWVTHIDPIVMLHHTIHIKANNVRAIGITSCFV